MRILFLSRWFPYPQNNGSKLRIYNLIRGLAQHHEVNLLSFADRKVEKSDIQECFSLCHEINVIPLTRYNPTRIGKLASLLCFTPSYYKETYSSLMEQSIYASLARGCDLVIASEVDTAVYHKCFRDGPALFEDVEPGQFYGNISKATSLRERIHYRLTWAKYQAYLSSLLKDFQACTVVSEQERSHIVNSLSKFPEIHIVPELH